jgi:hypothetical protein
MICCSFAAATPRWRCCSNAQIIGAARCCSNADMIWALLLVEAALVASQQGAVGQATHRLPPSEERMREYKELALQALADVDGWRDADARAVKLHDVTQAGNGGLRTLKITPPLPAAPVALKIGDAQQHGPYMERLFDVTAMMANHSLSPRLLATGPSWMITEWGGEFVAYEEPDPEAAFTAVGETSQCQCSM